MKGKDGMIVIGMGAGPGPMSDRPAKGGKSVVSVPVASLSAYDGESDVAPEIGDMVDFSASGKVLAINGNTAKVEIAKINGGEMDNESPAEDMGEDNEESMLRAEAEKEDENAMV